MTQILAAHIGSYPRIGDLKDHQRHRRGFGHFLKKDISAHAFRDVNQSVIQEAVAEQIESGLDEITDGLISWIDPISHFVVNCSGFRTGGLRRYFDTSFHYRIPVIIAKPRRKDAFILDEIKYAKSISSKPVRAILTGPLTLGYHSQSDSKTFSKPASRIALFADLLELEIGALAKEETPVIQIDEPSFLHHPEDAAVLKKILERFVKKAANSKIILAVSFFPPQPKFEILFDQPAHGLQIDAAGDLKGLLTRLDSSRSFSSLGMGVINAQNTRQDLLDPILNSLTPWLEKVKPEKFYLTPSNGLEFLPRDSAMAKLKSLARLKTDLVKRLSLPEAHV